MGVDSVVTGPSSASVSSLTARRPSTPGGHESPDVLDPTDPLVVRHEVGPDPHPGRTASGDPASSTCSMAVAAPSSGTSTQANGWSRGCCGAGSATQAQVVTVPSGPTSTRSPVASAVCGSYSVGGTMTRPPVPVAPRILPSRSPVRKAPMTGPTEREYGYSSTWALVRTSSPALAMRVLPGLDFPSEPSEVEHISVSVASRPELVVHASCAGRGRPEGPPRCGPGAAGPASAISSPSVIAFWSCHR